MAVALPAPAGASPGGAASGRLAVDWSGQGQSGHAEISLDPGAGPRSAALTALRNAQPHYRRPTSYFLQGAHIAALSGQRSTSFPCGDPPDTTTSTNSVTVLGLGDTRLPFTLDTPTLDYRRGRGVTGTSPWEDNPGYPGLPIHLSYFLPVPGKVTVRRARTGCGEADPPASEDEEINAFDWRGESAVPVDFVRWLDGWDVPLRRHGKVWSAAGRLRTTGPGGSVTFDVTYDLRLHGKVTDWNALCRVPEYGHTGRTVGSALAAMRRAGFPRVRFAGNLRTNGYPAGRVIVDPHFTSSGLATCLTSRPKVYRVVPFR